MRRVFGLVAVALSAVLALQMFWVSEAKAVQVTDIYVSDESDLWWSGANVGNIDSSGYIVPPPEAVWQNAVFCWEHSSWNTNLNPPDRKAKLFESPTADWIWKSYQVSLGESYTGDIVFFKKMIYIPEYATDIYAELFIVTADNAYYFYINDDWSGEPVGKAGFISNYGPTNFYYVSDGVNNLGGGTNSVAYETIGNVYPKDAAIDTSMTAWSSIELYDITPYLQAGENWLQIVAINEHAPPSGVTSNPAGLIYKLIIHYEMPLIIDIDVKPGSFPNSICLSDQGLLPVAILGSETFDVTQIDPSTVNVGGVYITLRGSPKKQKLAYSFEDVNADGYMDLIAFFSVPELVSAGVLAEDTISLRLDGYLYDGTWFVGTDSVNIVPP